MKCKENTRLQQMHACFNHHHYLIDRLRLHSMATYEIWNEMNWRISNRCRSFFFNHFERLATCVIHAIWMCIERRRRWWRHSFNICIGMACSACMQILLLRQLWCAPTCNHLYAVHIMWHISIELKSWLDI